jgi:hypothetical protein
MGVIGMIVFGLLSFVNPNGCFGVLGNALLILVGVGLYYRRNWAFYGGILLVAFRLGYYWTSVFASEQPFVFLLDALVVAFAMMLLIMSYKEFELKLIKEPPGGSDLRYYDLKDLKCEKCGSDKLHIPVENIAECQSCGHEFSFKGPKGR